jgi:hypothetical protein
VFYDETFTITVESGNDDPTSKLECKKGGYKEFGLTNQGRCIKAVNHVSK